MAHYRQRCLKIKDPPLTMIKVSACKPPESINSSPVCLRRMAELCSYIQAYKPLISTRNQNNKKRKSNHWNQKPRIMFCPINITMKLTMITVKTNLSTTFTKHSHIRLYRSPYYRASSLHMNFCILQFSKSLFTVLRNQKQTYYRHTTGMYGSLLLPMCWEEKKQQPNLLKIK